MARIATGIGMKVIAYNRSPRALAPVPMLGIDELLQHADIVSLHLTLNDETRGFLDRAKLAKTKPGVIIVNTSRAAVIDGAALVELLRSGHIGHYATDVFLKEPPDPHDPLLALDNVTLTAHAGYNTPEAAMTMYRRAIDLAKAG
jgi:D-3-phosphoglycerate dehydrogenase